MPLPRTYDDQNSPVPLSTSQVRVLQLLADGAWLRRGRVEEETGTTTGLSDLLIAGYVTKEEVDLDGLIETTWGITSKGRTALERTAPVIGIGRNGEQMALERPKIGAVAPWFGGCRREAEAVGESLRGCAFVAVPFCGGLSEVPAIVAAGAQAVALNDAHRHLINMARCIADSRLGPQMWRRLRRMPFSYKTLSIAQAYCAVNEPDDEPDLECAFHYFICAWMARSAEAGKAKEFQAGLAIRWGAGGGNSVLRFHSAVFSLRAWRAILQRCSFSADDAFAFLGRINDRCDAGVYVDPPWPEVGKGYEHRFSDAEHERLQRTLHEKFTRARVVVRSGGGPLIERLYPRTSWRWLEMGGRSQANKVATEWLISKNIGT